jgi:hypothetical protein
MIVVLGRPRVHRPEPDGGLEPGGLAVEVALAAAASGADVQLVGSIGDDPEGDRIVVALGQAGVGHAALLRDPAARTPLVGRPRDQRRLPRLDADDVHLGLRYVSDCRVLVVAAKLDRGPLQQALDAAAFHDAAVVIVALADDVDPESFDPAVTVLARPATEDEGDAAADDTQAIADERAFAAFVAAYATGLDEGQSPAQAFAGAVGESHWERAPDG